MAESRAARDVLSTYLDRGERLVWQGQPIQGLMLRPTDAVVIPFSLMWAGFAVFWESSVINDRAPFFFKLWGIPFVLAGFYMVVGRFFADAWLRRGTIYGLTDRRALILSGLFRRELRSVDLRLLPELTLSEGRNGRGTITFGRDLVPMRGWQHPGMNRNAAPAFEGIDDAARLMRRIRDLQAALSPS